MFMGRSILRLVALFLLCGALWPMKADAKPIKILAFGDSLTAGYGLPEAQGFTRRLEAALKAEVRELAAEFASELAATDAAAAALEPAYRAMYLRALQTDVGMERRAGPMLP